MRDFTKVCPQIWATPAFRSLKDDSSRLFYLYLYTNRHQNSAGLYPLPPAYAASDLGWAKKNVQTAMDELIKADMIVFDKETSEVLITGWFEVNPPMNSSHFKGCNRQINHATSEKLKAFALDACDHAWQRARISRASNRRNPYLTIEQTISVAGLP